MDPLTAKILEIAGTVVLTVVVTAVVALLADRVLQPRNGSLYGRWLCTWQPNPGDPKWVTEFIDISFSWRSLWFNLAKYRGRLLLANSNNSDDYQWRGYADVVGSRDVIGVWHSIQPGSHSKGVFVLAIHPQGRYLYGYWVGPNEDDRTVLGAIVLGRKAPDVENAKQHLFSCQISGVPPLGNQMPP